MHTMNQLALLLNSEIAAVITAMRQNAKWAVVPGKYNEEDHMEPEPHYDDFRTLRRKIFEWEDWPSISPLDYLTPFLKLVREPEVSGPITGVALTSIWRLLTSNIIDLSTTGVEEALNQIVEDTVLCKFEATNPSSDEIVLFNILQVLVAVVRCEAAVLLSDEAICQAYQAAFMLGNLSQDPKNKTNECSELLTHYSRQIIGEMTTLIFSRLAQKARNDSAEEMPNGDHSKAATSPERGVQCALEVLNFLIELIHKSSEDPPQGLGDEYTVFGLSMVHRALLAGGPCLAEYPAMLRLVHVSLFPAIAHAVKYPTLGTINGICQVILTLFQTLGQHSILQLEAVIGNVLLKLADGKGTGAVEQQEAALEGILDLCRQPNFVHAVFLNCDCRLDRTNLFEDVCSLVSKTAFPITQKSLGPLHLISLEALIAILNAIWATRDVAVPQLHPRADLPHFVDIWGAIAAGTPPPITDFAALGVESAAEAAATAAAGADADAAAAVREAELRPARAAAFEKQLKTKASVAVDHFNKDYKKGFQYLQASNLLPELPPPKKSKSASKLAVDAPPGGADDGATPPADPGATVTATVTTGGPAGGGKPALDEEALARCIGNFLRVCPGLQKTTIGELLGEPDPFYLKVLDAYTATFAFSGMSFDAALRMFLESFWLPGEAQKIDRIIECFGRRYFEQTAADGIFANSDACYVLAYSVIMLNTDRHSSQVKKKMTQEDFRRNLRGTNDKADFPESFLHAIYDSIVANPFKIRDASASGVSPTTWVHLNQLALTERGQMVLPRAAQASFNSYMFHIMWGPAVHAMSVVMEYSDSGAVTDMALEGLRLAVRIAGSFDIDDVADGVALALCKFTAPLSPGVTRPRVAFGREPKACAAMEALFHIVNRYGDCLRAGWCNIMDVVLRLHKLDLLPPALWRLYDDGAEDGRTAGSGESPPRYRRVQSRSQLPVPTSFFRSVSTQLTQLIALPSEPEFADRVATQVERDCEARTLACLEACHIEDMFADSKFLKAESLLKLVQAIVWASGPLTKGPPPGGSPDWEAAEVCLDLLLVVLLRNRDRIALLWPTVFDHLAAVVRGKGVDGRVVERAAVGILRLCGRLLPYKPDAAEQLLRGLQLVTNLDPEMAWQNAERIAAEMLALVKVAAPHIVQQWAWTSVCNVLKMTAIKPEAYATAFEALSWCVKESLNPLNFILCLEACCWFASRSVEHGASARQEALALLDALEVWLGLWSDTLAREEGLTPASMQTHWSAKPKAEMWLMLVEMLCKLAGGELQDGSRQQPDVRNAAAALLTQAMGSAERMQVLTPAVERALSEQLMPWSRAVAKGVGLKDTPQADVTLREMLKAISKLLLLYLTQLRAQPSFGSTWRAHLELLQAGAGKGSDVLTESVPEATKNLFLVLHAKGVLVEGWRDEDGTDLWELTWRTGKKISANITPSMLQPGQAQ